MLKRIIFVAILVLASISASAPTYSAESQETIEEQNKQIAIEFYNAALNEKNWEKTRSFIGNRYIQHNLSAIDGPEGLKAHIEFLKRDFPNNHGEIKHVL